MKLSLKTPKPRNPFAMAGRRRSAGAHRNHCPRQQARIELRRELDRIKPCT